MSAFETLRPIMEKYIVEPDSLQTAFDEPTTDLFSLGMDSMGAFAPAWAKRYRTPSARLPRMQTGARGVCYSPRSPRLICAVSRRICDYVYRGYVYRLCLH